MTQKAPVDIQCPRKFLLCVAALDAELVVRTVEGAVLMGAEEPLAVVRKPFYGMLRLLDMTEKEAMEILEKGGFLDG